ncbi:MAG: hypothetical protein R2685_04030 [Candidatus Nitrosocosmicus sp.]|nr:hypothetical protein [Candidatus Nitrosocosmicus sp.]
MLDDNESYARQEYKKYVDKVNRGSNSLKENLERKTNPRTISTTSDNIKELIRTIPIDIFLNTILYSIIQTQDIFLIRFQSEYSECDISIYEFKKYADIRTEVVERLNELRFNKQVKQSIIHNLDVNSRLIDVNIEYFGVPHIFD